MNLQKRKPLGDVIKTIKTGSTPPTTRQELFGGLIPWFTPGDIGEVSRLVKSARYLTQQAIDEGEAKLFDRHMLLVTCIGDIGRVGILEKPASSNQQITALKFHDEINVHYAYYWFVAHRHLLEREAN